MQISDVMSSCSAIEGESSHSKVTGMVADIDSGMVNQKERLRNMVSFLGL